MTVFRERPGLLPRFRAGESAALAEVYHTYVALVTQIVRHSFFGSSDWQDYVQECFIKAFSPSARQGYDGLREYRPYLLSICRHVLVDAARKRARTIQASEIDQAIEASVAAPSMTQALDPRLQAVVTEYLAGLPPDLRGVYQQRYEVCASQADTAKALGLSRQRVRTMEDKLRAGLDRLLRAKGFDDAL